MAKIGYARVSSKEQHLDRQLAALKDVDKLFTDKLSGANTNRPELQKMLAYIREGDIVLVTELDRLGRNNQDLTQIMNTIQNKGATLDVLNLPSMTGIADPNLRQLMTNLIIELYKYQAESERKRIIERQQQGISLAKQQGKYHGRKPQYTQDDPRLQHAFKLYQELKSYQILTWINNAGFGNYDSVDHQNLDKITKMLHLNIESLTILSSLYVKDYKNVEGTQLINLSSRGGYMLVKNAVTYCASKFYVSAFTEGLALELAANHCPLKAKVLAPAATKSEFGQVAADTDSYDYDKHFTTYHTSKEMADFLIELYYSDKIVGLVDINDFDFKLSEPLFKH